MREETEKAMEKWDSKHEGHRKQEKTAGKSGLRKTFKNLTQNFRNILTLR